MKAFTLGPLNPSVNIFQWLEFILHKHLPSDAHKLANGRLSVSATRVSDGEHIVMSEFQSKEEVVQVSRLEAKKKTLTMFLKAQFTPNLNIHILSSYLLHYLSFKIVLV